MVVIVAIVLCEFLQKVKLYKIRIMKMKKFRPYFTTLVQFTNVFVWGFLTIFVFAGMSQILDTVWQLHGYPEIELSDEMLNLFSMAIGFGMVIGFLVAQFIQCIFSLDFSMDRWKEGYSNE